MIAAAGRLCESRAESPLPLTAFRRHTVTMMLLGFELGRLLRLTHPHKISAAALARNVGLWTLALGAPLWAALAVAGNGSAQTRRAARQALLGLDTGEAG